MELYQIRYFLALCGTLNFTRAAGECNVSQPALTRAVKKLEDELGGELFRRERSRTHLTELGRAMQPFLQQSLDSALAAKEQAQNYGRGGSTPLHLGISSTIDIQLLLPALKELERALPGLKLHLVRMPASAALQDLENGDIELSVMALDETAWDRIDQWSLFTEKFVFLAASSNSLGLNATIEFADLRDQQIYVQSSCENADSLISLLRASEISAEARHSFSDKTDLVAAIGEGTGVGLVPQSTRIPENISAIPLQDHVLQRTVSLFAVSGRRYSTAASGLIRLLRSGDWSQYEARAM